MFHIIFLSPHCDPEAQMGELDSGGQCIYEHQLALALSAQPEFSITTFCRQNFHRPDESIVNNSYRIVRIHCGEPKPIRKEEIEGVLAEFTSKVSQQLVQINPEDHIVLHGHYWDGAYAALSLKSNWSRRLPFIWTPHSLGSLKRRKFYGSENEFFYNFISRQSWESYGMHIADRVILSTEKEKQSVLDDYSSDENKIRTIPPGVDTQRLHKIDKAAARKKLGLPAEGKILLSMGRMVRNKGYHRSILALEELLKKYKDPVYLAIYGFTENPSVDEVGKYQHELRELITARHLEKVVFLKPTIPHDEVHEVFSAADLFLMSSEHEPFGLVTIEAMAMGLPVIAANSGGSLSIIKHNKTGILTDFQQPERVASYLFSLLRDDDTYDRIGQAASRHVKKNYDWAEKSAEFAQQYRQISRKSDTEFFAELIKKNFFLQKHFAVLS